MKKWIILLVVLTLLVGGASLLFKTGFVPASSGRSSTAEPTLPAVKASGVAVARGRIVPVRSVTLSFPSGGRVADVRVAEGDHVEAGRILLTLDSDLAASTSAQTAAALQRAQAVLDRSRARPRKEEIAIAEASLAAAQAALSRLQEGPDANLVVTARAELDNATAALAQAQAAYDQVKWQPGIGARPESLRLQEATNNWTAAKGRLDLLMQSPSTADLAAAEAEVSKCQAQLDLLMAGPRPEDISIGEADVAIAKAAYQQAEIVLAGTELHAPFAGSVAWLTVRPGEFIGPGVPVVRLVDLTAWQVETEDLTESAVTQIREGDRVSISMDAISGLELPGVVTHLRALGENVGGDITYVATIRLDVQDERLRWNMTASVTFFGAGDVR